MTVEEITLTTTGNQLRRLKLLASMAGVSLNQAIRAAVYLGVDQALDERADNGDLLTVHSIDQILAVAEVGAADMTIEGAIDGMLRDHQTIAEDLGRE